MWNRERRERQCRCGNETFFHLQFLHLHFLHHDLLRNDDAVGPAQLGAI
jgi:hypothetical protein